MSADPDICLVVVLFQRTLMFLDFFFFFFLAETERETDVFLISDRFCFHSVSCMQGSRVNMTIEKEQNELILNCV